MPTILVHSEDPSTIGDFLVKYEHEKVEGAKPIDAGDIISSLKKLFNKIEEHELVHMIIFLAIEPINYP